MSAKVKSLYTLDNVPQENSRWGQKCHMCYDRGESVNDISYQNVAD